ncbi:MAG: hypothetical protein ACE5FH_03165 [Candidatus Zixiibacteriota bacterium]
MLVVACAATVAAQENEVADSSAVDSVASDSLYEADRAILDSLLADSLLADSLGLDSLSDAERAQVLFQRRFEALQQERPKRPERLSYLDTLLAYFVSDRSNQRRLLDRSFYHDAGDNFRFDPSYFIVENQATPMRKTVQPFGLSGDRLNVLANGQQLRPFDHTIEPDGLSNMDDFPTTIDNDVYLLPGPAGMVFGGGNAVASLITRRKRPGSTRPESRLFVDKGSFAYNYVRGRYSKRFVSGRELDLSVGYRNADGVAFGREDDAFHYVGDVYLPVSLPVSVKGEWRLYDRRGPLAIAPDAGGPSFARHRFDRSVRGGVEVQNAGGTRRFEFGYRHKRQGSNLDGFDNSGLKMYKGRFGRTLHGGYLETELTLGSSVLRVAGGGDDENYEDGSESFHRGSGDLSFSLAHPGKTVRYAFVGGGNFVESFDFLPAGALLLAYYSGRLELTASAGYYERAPSMHELHLAPHQAKLFAQVNDYEERGNDSLIAEKQLVGNLTVSYGGQTMLLTGSVTAGKITDGIEWNRTEDSILLQPSSSFSPINTDIDFFNVTGMVDLAFSDFFRFHGGGASRSVDLAAIDDRAYLPDYQLFGGAELHYYWRQKITDLFAYGEIVYNGPYHGYQQDGLGETVVANVKLSFRMKDFRFHYVFQNVLNTVYQSRERLSFPGQFSYYGFTWDFMD